MQPKTTTAALLLLTCACGGGGSSIQLPDDAVGTAEAVIRHLGQNEPEVLWAALPASYQRDVSTLVHEFAGKVDVELWDQTFALLRKIVGVLRDQKEFILATPLAASFDAAQARVHWDSVIGMFETIADSDLAHAASLRRLDIGAFLRADGRTLMARLAEVSKLTPQDPFALVRQASVELVAASGGVTTVRVHAPGKPAQEVRLKRHEDRWLPVELVAEWSAKIAQARASVARMPAPQDDESKAQAQMILAMAESVVDRLAAATTQEQFDTALGSVIGMAMAGPGK